MTLSVHYLNPFLEAAAEVLEADASLGLWRGDIGLNTDAFETADVTVLLSLIGQVWGLVLYTLDERTALTLVSRVMGRRFAELDALAESGVAELGNVITGRASVKLSEAGMLCTISPPAVIRGRRAVINTLDLPRLVVPLHSDAGSIVAHLALRDGVRPDARELAIMAEKPSIEAAPGQWVVSLGQARP